MFRAAEDAEETPRCPWPSHPRMSAVKIMILLCQFIFFLVTFTFQLSILIPFLFIWSPPDEYKRPVILYCDQSCNVWRSFNNKAKYYNDSSHLWQGRSLMSFLQSTDIIDRYLFLRIRRPSPPWTLWSPCRTPALSSPVSWPQLSCVTTSGGPLPVLGSRSAPWRNMFI